MKLSKAQTKLVEDNIGLAYLVANRYMKANYNLVNNKGLDLEELVQVALEQLCERAKTYNPDIAKPSTYFFNSMYLKINMFVRGFNQVKIPRYDTWMGRFDDESKTLVAIMHGNLPSLDQPVGESESSFLRDISGERDNSFDRVELDSLFENILNTLDDEERYILKCHLQGKSQKETGQKLRYSQAVISRRLRTIKERLRKYKKSIA